MPTATEQTAQRSDDLFRIVLDRFPVELSVAGIREREDQLTDYTEAGEDALRSRLRHLVNDTEGIDATTLDDRDRVTRAVVARMAASLADNLSTRSVEYTVTDSLFAPAIHLLSILPMITITAPTHAQGYLARLAQLPKALADIAERHRTGIAAGRAPVRRLVDATVAHLDRHLAEPQDPLQQPQPFADSDVDASTFATERDRLVAEVVRPALMRYRDVLATEVAPKSRPDDRPGLCWLPAGAENYAALVRQHTTTERSPDELHQVGLDIIAALTAEYAEVGARLFGTTDVREILTRLRTDPALRWRDGEEMVTAARAAIARAEQAAAGWFGTLPAQRCTVEPVPAVEAPGAGAAYYRPPALDGSRPGTYFINTHQATGRSRATYEAVAFHEAVPGHHFQRARQQELTDLPLILRLGGFTAYSEGWALYAERLADEMGLYSDDLARLGMLSEDSMRAARLVVDTGLHAMGWSRQQVVDYLLANTATPAVEIESEADRYIAAPGQALSYMTGRLEIQRIRAQAEQALADRFDIRAFHDTVLGYGPLPLNVLEEVVRRWTEATLR